MGAIGRNKTVSTENIGSGITANNMFAHLNEIQANVRENNREAVNIINRVKNDPDAPITIYKATASGSIHHGDWVFLDKKHAERWTRNANGTKKKGVKLVSKVVHAEDIEWSKRNLEFLFK